MLKFDNKRKRYRNAKGRIISDRAVRREIDRMVVVTEKRMRALAEKFNQTGNLPQLQIDMAEIIKSSHIVAATVAQGGKDEMTARDWAELGRELKEQYKYLNRFAREIEQGRVSAAQITNRAASYSKAALVAFETRALVQKKKAGIHKAKRVLHSLEGCEPCRSWARRGFVPIEIMPKLGSLSCGQNCRCSFIYQ